MEIIGWIREKRIFRVDAVLCTSSADHHHRKRLLPVPRMPLKWGIPSISRNIDSHVLFFCALEYIQLRKLPCLLSILGLVWGVRSVNVSFFVLSKQCGMKNIVNPPCLRQFQLVCDWSNDSCYLKRSFSPWTDLLVVVCLQISRVQPYTISQLERSKCGSLPICHSISG